MTKKIDWHSRAQSMHIDGRAFIDGERVETISQLSFPCISPIDGKTIAIIARAQAVDIDRAVLAARHAFEDRRWADLPPKQRKSILLEFADAIVRNKEELALLETLDMGKPIRYSLAVDVPLTANCLRWYAEAIDKLYGEIAPTPVESLALITREPVGVVAAITPWNYPMLMAAWKLAPALAAGNSVVLKPSEKASLSAMRLAELAVQAGLPKGVLNVVPGYGHEAGAALALHADVDCIGFTGSTRVGKLITQYAGQSNLKRVWTELGGKSANIVCADCPDLDRAVRDSLAAIFFNQGESCNAPSRLLIEASIKPQFMERALALVQQFQPGNPLDEACVMGAIVDETQLNAILAYIESGREQGAQLICGGRQVYSGAGFFVEPTIFDQVTPSMTIAKEEIFGPVLSVMSFDHIDEAIHIANASDYGLHAAVWTNDLNKAIRASRALRAGTVHINSYDEDDITVPFGGYKQSGNGRDKSLHAFEKYTELKTTWIKMK